MSLSVINTLPTMTSMEEYGQYQQTTPTDFSLPAVLRHCEKDVALSLQPATALDYSELEQGTRGDLYINDG